MLKKILLATSLCLTLGSGAAVAAECSSSWTPTFVRFGGIVYYNTGGSFIRAMNPQNAQQLCLTRGVRRTINGQNCRTRPWGDFTCGCNNVGQRNPACRRLYSFLGIRR